MNKSDDREQWAAFRKAARDLGCDENEQRLKDALRTIAKQKPKEAKERHRAAADPA